MSIYAGRLLSENLSDIIPGMELSRKFWRNIPGQNTIQQLQLQRFIPDGHYMIRNGRREWVSSAELARSSPITEHVIDQLSRQPGSGYIRTFDDVRF